MSLIHSRKITPSINSGAHIFSILSEIYVSMRQQLHCLFVRAEPASLMLMNKIGCELVRSLFEGGENNKFGLFLGIVCWVVWGGCEAILVRETPAQFAVYKSPEQGLNLSRS